MKDRTIKSKVVGQGGKGKTGVRVRKGGNRPLAQVFSGRNSTEGKPRIGLEELPSWEQDRIKLLLGVGNYEGAIFHAKREGVGKDALVGEAADAVRNNISAAKAGLAGNREDAKLSLVCAVLMAESFGLKELKMEALDMYCRQFIDSGFDSIDERKKEEMRNRAKKDAFRHKGDLHSQNMMGVMMYGALPLSIRD